jgi:excisionase family DNA binding protein
MKLLTVKNVSTMLGVKEKTLYQWVEMGQIPHVKINGCVRFDSDDIQAWIDDCKKKAQSSYNPFTRLEARKGGRKTK